MLDTLGQTKQFNEFGHSLPKHTEHLMDGVRYWRGCPWCELSVGDPLLATADAVWYEAAQAGPKLQMKFNETPANMRAVYDKYAAILCEKPGS